jgi:phosphate:Na+ symporter
MVAAILYQREAGARHSVRTHPEVSMTVQVALNAAGGLALFLLAMLMMTEGLKAFAGSGLKALLERSTRTPLRGVLAGMVVTGLVQSSSAVTVATIGFVNAGVLTLRQALGVIFGTNVGTTMTGWLVSLVGFGFKVESFALPILALGVVLRLGATEKRRQGLGEALAGFGLFFLGLAILKDAFGGIADVYGASLPGGDGAGGWAAFVLVGFVATVLNVVTGAVALLLLPVMLWLVRWIAAGLEVEGSPAAVLALFHTVFNVLGVAIMLPFAARLATFLERLFRDAEEDIGKPRFLDATLKATPELAVAALHEELGRLRDLVRDAARAALLGAGANPGAAAKRAEATRALGAEVAEFIAAVGAESMPRTVADELAGALRTSRYLDEAARLTPRVDALRARETGLGEGPRELVTQSLAEAAACVAAGGDGAALERFMQGYERTKNGLLRATVERALPVAGADELLDALSATRRLVEQLAKADRLLRPEPAADSKSS